MDIELPDRFHSSFLITFIISGARNVRICILHCLSFIKDLADFFTYVGMSSLQYKHKMTCAENQMIKLVSFPIAGRAQSTNSWATREER